MGDDDLLAPDLSEGPLPNRITRGTLLGCSGLLSVLAMPALLFVPLERWAAPLWLWLLVPLVAFALAALGTWLLMCVPASSPMRSRDPAHPLTGTGQAPVLERPAARANRVAASSLAALVLAGMCGYLLASGSAMVLPRLERGIALSGIAGVVLIGDGLLVAGRRLPVPAVRWVRVPVQSSFSRQGAPLVLVGLVWVTWALWVALEDGIGVGAAGLALLTLAAVAAAPLARRAPPGGRRHDADRPNGRRLPVTDAREQED